MNYELPEGTQANSSCSIPSRPPWSGRKEALCLGRFCATISRYTRDQKEMNNPEQASLSHQAPFSSLFFHRQLWEEANEAGTE